MQESGLPLHKRLHCPCAPAESTPCPERFCPQPLVATRRAALRFLEKESGALRIVEERWSGGRFRVMGGVDPEGNHSLLCNIGL